MKEMENLGKFKVRKNGNSLIVTMPKESGFSENEMVEAVKGSDGSISYKPTEQNPWFSGKYKNYDFEAIKNELDFPVDGGRAVGKEII
ncbi:AbrB/MazE/SpoVT family DNA-binding domain-containing protein [Companilactobacillus hulinensis]|uniref:AbrB/MazE/SpoVT family DNA-binding domain-containing protein n=1 Tax=Companilactobacillus hulinensis TaxID=2486007 RepID=UPI000F7A57EB|nr:hypothetical protein [Companilactobacillus hulinensis]